METNQCDESQQQLLNCHHVNFGDHLTASSVHSFLRLLRWHRHHITASTDSLEKAVYEPTEMLASDGERARIAVLASNSIPNTTYRIGGVLIYVNYSITTPFISY